MAEHDEKWLASLKVPELKEELKKRGLPTDGKKADLAGRLKDALQDDAPAEDNDAADEAAADGAPAATNGGSGAAQQDDPPDKGDDDNDAPEEVDPASLTVAALREELQKRGLSTAGKKADLVDRLTEAQAAKHTDASGEASAEAASEAADADPAEAEPEAAADDDADGGEDAEEASAGEEAAEEPAPADGDDAPDAEPDTEEQVDPASMTVAQLKEQLADRGLSVQGRKSELVARLTDALAAADDGPAEAGAVDEPAAEEAAAAEPAAEQMDAQAEDVAKAADGDEDVQQPPENVAEAAEVAVDDAQPEQPAREPEQEKAPEEDQKEEEGVTAMEEEAADEPDAEVAVAAPAAAEAEEPPAEDVAQEEEDQPVEEAMREDEQPEAAPAAEEPMPAADTVRTAEAAAGPIAKADAPPAQPEAAKPDPAGPQAGAQAMDAEDGVELDFEEAEEPEAVPEQQARKRPHEPISAAKGDHAPAKLQKVESGGKSELRQPSGVSPSVVVGSAPRQPCPRPNMDPTPALLIEGFTRPFTKSQVDALLSQHGRVAAMWMPNIKNLAYVIYESADVAEDTRQSLYSLQWPKDSPKRLMPKFVTLEEAQAACTGKALPGKAPAQKPAAQAAPPAAASSPRTNDATPHAAEPPKQHAGDARALLTERRSASQKEKAAQAPAVAEEEDEYLDLDAIFRKTETEPALYWLPLTEEQAAARAAAKAKPSLNAAQNDKVPQLNGTAKDVKARP